jgi:hypothetical protein
MNFVQSCCMALAIGFAAVAPSAFAHAVVGVSVGFAPPPARAERVVVAHPGRAWIPGYWRWNGAHYAWAAGYTTYARPGYRYVPARWVRSGSAWRFHVGYWSR